MKFTNAQHIALTVAMQNAGRSSDEFSLIKRKGRINVIENLSRKSFVYFKKKTATLDPITQRLEAGEHFLVFHSDMEEQSFSSFDNVIVTFEFWLKIILSK